METPISTLLSQVLITHTIELDNEFERRFAAAGVGRRFGVSLVMWSNFMRFVGDGIAVGELPEVAAQPKPRLHSMVGGMERWRYVFVGPESAPEPDTRRDGWGSGRGLRRDWVVRPTPAGRKTQELWPPLHGDIERRWAERFGTHELRELRQSLETVVGQLAVGLPEYLPLIAGANGLAAEVVPRERQTAGRDHLSTLLAQALLAYTLDFERESGVSLPLSANFLRVLGERGLDVRDLPAAAGVSKEATSIALRFLTKGGYVVADTPTKLVRLTPKGSDAKQAARRAHASVERAWRSRYGVDAVDRLRAALQAVLDQPARLSQGLQPPPDGWRAKKPYAEQTKAVLDDPIGRLPHYPMVLHRGGWPDGS